MSEDLEKRLKEIERREARLRAHSRINSCLLVLALGTYVAAYWKAEMSKYEPQPKVGFGELRVYEGKLGNN